MTLFNQLVHDNTQKIITWEDRHIHLSLESQISTIERLLEILPQLGSGEVSTESMNYLSLTGYSPEAEEDKKSFMRRIWDAIKAGFKKLKEFIGRMIEMRKHHLKHNDFKFDKLKKYVDNLDLSLKPTGKATIHTSLLPKEPGKMIEGCRKVMEQTKTVMAFRKKCIELVDRVNFSETKPGDAKKGIESISTGKDEVVPGDRSGSAVFTNVYGLPVSYLVVLKSSDVRPVEAASIILMKSLLSEAASIKEQDGRYLQQIQSEELSFSRVVDRMESKSTQLWEAAMDGIHGSPKPSEEKFQLHEEVKQYVKFINQARRLSHSHVFDCLYEDLMNAVKASLGQYKLKKSELAEEDRK